MSLEVAFSSAWAGFSRTCLSVNTMLTLIISGVGVSVGVFVRVEVGVREEVAVGVEVREGVREGVAEAVTVLEGVLVGMDVRVREGVAVPVRVGVTVNVLLGVGTGVFEEVPAAFVVVTVPEGKAVGVFVRVLVAAGSVRDGVLVMVGTGVRVEVREAGRVAVESAVFVGVSVGAGVRVMDGVDVTVGGSPVKLNDPEVIHSVPMKMRTS